MATLMENVMPGQLSSQRCGVWETFRASQACEGLMKLSWKAPITEFSVSSFAHFSAMRRCPQSPVSDC